MKLGYIDKVNNKTIYYMPKKDGRKDLLNRESSLDYAKRFFNEIQGLGNVYLIFNGRIIGNRAF